MTDQIRVLLSTEGTYPFHQGGVSTWCETLVTKMDMVDFVIYSIIGNPFITQKFKLPVNASLQTVPLWGTEEPKEYLEVPFADIYLPKMKTTEAHVRDHFMPLFVQLIEEILSEVKNPQHFGQLLVALYEYFQTYDYQVSFKSEATWDVYKQLVLQKAADKRNRLTQPDVFGLIQSIGWVYRFFSIVNTPIPKTHLTHSTAAAFCGIPCVIAKLKDKTPYLLTEHGVYLREQYLAMSKQPYSTFLTTFLIRLVQSLTTMNYAFADQVSPVCAYNTRWETRFGVPPERIQVIQNGVDQSVFTEAPPLRNPYLTVVMMARIDPLKDILTFLRAAEIVKQQFPNVCFVLYGSVSVPAYYEECLELREQLHLQEEFLFAGHTSNTAAAYQSGDVVALSSISEAFPYSVIEGMMTGKPLVATDVGGVSEALGDTGLLVAPCDPQAFAEALLKLLQNADLRDALGRDARQRALNFFTLDKVIELHLKTYIRLASHANERVVLRDKKPVATLERQKLLYDKGCALASLGLHREAILQFQAALQVQPDSPLVPIVLTSLSKSFHQLGEHEQAMRELEKCSAYVMMMEGVARETA